MKRQRLVMLGILIIIVVSAFSLVGRQVNRPVTVRGDRVEIIRLYGAIQESGGGLLAVDGAITPRGVAQRLNKAAANPAIRAVVLRVSSPGGSVSASQEIYDMIQRFPKPIVISMGDMAASGGYYIAAAADGIVANPGTTTGSIGVISMMTSLEGLYDKLGIGVEIIKSGKHKDMGQRPLTEEERRLMQAYSDEAWEQFVNAIAIGRDMDVDYVKTLATGEIFIGTQAFELGLVDRLGGLDTAIAFAGELASLDNPVGYEAPPPSPWQQLMGAAVKNNLGPNVDIVRALQLLQAFEGIPTIKY